MCKILNVSNVIGLVSLIGFSGIAQNEKLSIFRDTLTKTQSDKITLLIYARIISDAKGNVRADENVVGNFKVIDWLKVEAGVRQGERPHHFDSYYHYKLELQTKSFWKTVRVITRISDNVINFPTPSFRKTNELVAVEVKHLISKHFMVFAAGGYLFSSQQNKEPDALPTNKGIQNNYPIFKLAVKYIINEKGHLELVYGSYDVFNPYLLNQPFGQLTANFDLSELCTFYSYLRYQYNNNVFTPNNYFFAAGIMFHLVKDKK